MARHHHQHLYYPIDGAGCGGEAGARVTDTNASRSDDGCDDGEDTVTLLRMNCSDADEGNDEMSEEEKP